MTLRKRIETVKLKRKREIEVSRELPLGEAVDLS